MKLKIERLRDFERDPSNNFLTRSEMMEAVKELIALRELKGELVPVAWTDAEELRDANKNGCGQLFSFEIENPYADPRRQIMLYDRPQKPVMANNGVTAENLRVIKMLLNVCAASFELADDSCQQDVDGELCHVVPDSAFSRLSDALGEIENTLPDEYEDLPNIVLQWAAIPRHALRSMFTAPQKPVISKEKLCDWLEDNFDIDDSQRDAFAQCFAHHCHCIVKKENE